MEKKTSLALVVPECISSSKEIQFCGRDVEDVLKQLHDWAFFEKDFTKLEGCTFQITGDSRLYEFSSTFFHYCFDHGRISVDELLEHCCYEC